jgi:hypothetical protein
VVLHSRRQRRAQRSACEEEYLAKIAAAQLSASPEPPTQKALCQAAGIPLSCVYSFPRVKAKVKDVVLSRKANQLHRTRQSQPHRPAANTVEGNDS